MHGRAVAPGAGTILNALSTGIGSAFALDMELTATVEFESSDEINGIIEGNQNADTRLIERCVSKVVEKYSATVDMEDDIGATVTTETEIPLAAGLKSSSAAANATILASADALGVSIDPLEACRLGVDAAREVGVAVTGAFDDASASMLGGVTVTDNTTDALLNRDTISWDALIYIPPEQAYSADADVTRCESVSQIANIIADMAHAGDFADAMTLNGLAFSAALGYSFEPAIEAMPHVDGVSLSGTGPSMVAVGDRAELSAVESKWNERPGQVLWTQTRNDGAHHE
ncbi:MAG: shikimate kinase [Haloquadratum sp. J07HQX50]|nr:MAG: shikimate kinase [Haloquadratum sp. J07HQX50]